MSTFVDRRDIYAPWQNNMRDHYDEAALSKLILSLEANGQLRACDIMEVCPHSPKESQAYKYIMIDGHTRFKARAAMQVDVDTKGISRDTLKVNVRPSITAQADALFEEWSATLPEGEEVTDAAHAEKLEELVKRVRLSLGNENHEVNSTRQTWPIYTQAVSFKDMLTKLQVITPLEEGQTTEEQETELINAIAFKGGLTPSLVQSRLSLVDPNVTQPDVQNAMKAGLLPYSVALEIRRVTNTDARKLIMNKAITEGHSLKQAKASIDKAVEAAAAGGQKIKNTRTTTSKTKKEPEVRNKEQTASDIGSINEALENMNPDTETDLYIGLIGARAALTRAATPKSLEDILTCVSDKVTETLNDLAIEEEEEDSTETTEEV